MRHTISVLVENRPGVLARVAGLFSSRGYNIESLTVSETEDPTTSRMTILVTGEDAVVEQINKQLNKLIEVIKVIDLTKERFINRELALIKVAVESKNKAEVMLLVEVFRAKIVDISPKTFTIEITGAEEKVSALLDQLKAFGIKEMVRTGVVAITRGTQYVPKNKK